MLQELSYSLVPYEAHAAARLKEIKTKLSIQEYLMKYRSFFQQSQTERDEKAREHIFAQKVIYKYLKDILNNYELFDDLNNYYATYKAQQKIHMSMHEEKNLEEKKLQAIFMLQQYLDANDENKRAIIDELTSISHKSRETIVTGFTKITEDLKKLEELDFAITKAWSTISDNPEFEQKMQQLIYRVPKEEGVFGAFWNTDTYFSKWVFNTELRQCTTVKWDSKSVIAECLQHTQFDKTLSFDTNELQTANFLKNRFSKQLFSPDILYLRELMQIRTSPSLQIPATINFFKDRLYLLNQKDIQVYLDINLFHPEYLTSALQEDPILINHIKQFLDKGIKSFSKESIPDLTGLYLMKLKLKLALWEGDTNSVKAHLEQVESILTSPPNAQKQVFNQIKETLYFQRASCLEHLLKQSPVNQDILKRLIQSVFLRNHYYQERLPKNLQEEDYLKKICHLIQIHINNIKPSSARDQVLKDTFNTILPTINPESRPGTWSINLPLITINNQTINLNTGLIITGEGLIKKIMPDNIIYNTTCKKLFGDLNTLSCLGKPDNDRFFKINYNNREYIIIIEPDDSISIYTKINLLGTSGTWFALQDVRQIDNIPEIFKEKNNLAWVDQQGNVLIEGIDKKNPYYYSSVLRKTIK